MKALARLLVLLAVAAMSPLMIDSAAFAEGCSTSDPVSVGAGQSGFHAGEKYANQCGDANQNLPATAVPGNWMQKPVCLGGAMMCDADGEEYCENGQPMMYVWFQPDEGLPTIAHTNCPEEATPDLGPTLDDIANAFRHIPLPDSVLQIQPPDGETLVNFDTNFLTEAEPFDTSVTLVGHTVDFKIHPAHFTWHYGDGETAEGTEPGRVYPNLDVTHRYRKKGTVAASVDTTWAADYRIDGGAWATVPDTVTMAGAPQQLTIRTATPLLAGS